MAPTGAPAATKTRAAGDVEVATPRVAAQPAGAANQPEVVREAMASSARLVVITVSDAVEVAATLDYIAVRGASAPVCELDPIQASLAGVSLAKLGVVRVTSGGRQSIGWKEPHGVCMLVTAQSPHRGKRILHIPPFSGEQEVRIDFALPECTLIAQVFDAALRGPVEGQPIEAVDAAGSVAWRGITGPEGLAVTHLPPAAYQVRVVGASPEDTDARAACHFLPSAGVQSRVVKLAVPEVRQAVPWEVRAEFLPAPGVSPALVVQRLDGAREWVSCVFPRLEKGLNQGSSALPAGTYRAMVLPQGCLDFGGGDGMFEVRGDVANEPVHMRLVAGEAATILLAGLPADALPVRVRFVRGEDLDESTASRAFTGKPSWQGTSGEVGRWEPGQGLLVHHRAKCWLGTLPPFRAGDRHEVLVEPATLLRVVHAVQPEADPTSLQLSLRSGGVEVIRSMRRRMADLGFGKQPVWAAEEVVRLGRWEVSLVGVDGVSQAGNIVDAAGGRHDVRL